MLRRPAVAGQFYPAQKEVLKKQLSDLVKEVKEKVEAKGILLPHAGYIYSGRVAGSVISKIKSCPHYIVMGPNHTGMGKAFSIISKGSWQMPLGEVEIDKDLAEALLKDSTLLEEDNSAHMYEHSIEVELPFLQYLNPEFRFVPMVIGQADLDAYKKLGKEIASVIKKTKKEVLIIASSDLTHYESQNEAERKDKLAISAILKLDPDSLWQVINQEDISMCGYAPCLSMLSCAKELGATCGELVMYETSGDVTGDKSSVVGYAGVIIN